MLDTWPDYEDQQPRRKTISPYWALVLVALCIACLPIWGCAANDPRVCYMKLMGHTENGYSVVAQRCVTPEEFAEEQK